VFGVLGLLGLGGGGVGGGGFWGGLGFCLEERNAGGGGKSRAVFRRRTGKGDGLVRVWRRKDRREVGVLHFAAKDGGEGPHRTAKPNAQAMKKATGVQDALEKVPQEERCTKSAVNRRFPSF